jgi:hypothetical protein
MYVCMYIYMYMYIFIIYIISYRSDGVEHTKLHPYNVNVRAENEKRLLSLPGQVYKALSYSCMRRP